MYGRDEYRYYVNRLDHERDVLTGVRETIELLLTEYHQDTRATFMGDEAKDARLALIAARTKVTEAMEAFDRALGSLPKVPEVAA